MSDVQEDNAKGYFYYVTYATADGIGCLTVGLREPITRSSDVKLLVEHIKQRFNKNCIITGWQSLLDETGEDLQ